MKPFLTALFIMVAFFCDAQQDYTFSGTVRNKSDGESLIGVAVHLKDQNIGTATNSYGFFSLTLAQGNYVVVVDYLGYGKQEINLILDKDIRQTIELEEVTLELDEVVITGKQSPVESVAMGVGRLTSDQIKKLPSLMGEPDLQRALISMPGITSVGEFSNGFNVRGGKVDHNLLLVDEATLYNSTHLFGLISVVNTDAIKEVKVLKSAIPAKYGGRAGSVVNIFLNSGNKKQFRVKGGIGPLSTKLSLEIPIVKERLNIYLSGRRSFADLVMSAVSDEGSVGFYDATSKITYNLNTNNTFYLSGYFGKDIFQFLKENLKFSWGNATASFRWNHIFSDKVFSNLIMVTGNYEFTFEGAHGDLFFESSNQDKTKYTNGVKNKTVKYDIAIFPSPKLELNTGLGSTYYIFNSGRLTTSKNRINTDKSMIEYYGYGSGVYNVTDKLTLSTGIRLIGMSYTGPGFSYQYDPDYPANQTRVLSVKRHKANEIIASYYNYEPRVSVNYRIKKQYSLKAAFDKLVQNSHLLSNSYSALPFDSWTTSTENILPTVTHQYSLGGAMEQRGFTVELTGFYKNIDNLLLFRSGVNPFLLDYIETKTVPAIGKAYGVELSITKNAGRLSGQLNYTFSRAFFKTTSMFPEIQINEGAFYPSSYDRPNVLNINANYQISKRVTLTGQFSLQTGRPITLPNGSFGGIPVYTKVNQDRLPVMHRLDVGINLYPREKNKGRKWKGFWSFSLINIYGKKNPYSYFVTFNDQFGNNTGQAPAGMTLKQLSVIGVPIPSISYNFQLF